MQRAERDYSDSDAALAATGFLLKRSGTGRSFPSTHPLRPFTIVRTYLNNRRYLSAKSMRFTKILATRMIVRTLTISTIQTLRLNGVTHRLKARSGMSFGFLLEAFLKGITKDIFGYAHSEGK